MRRSSEIATKVCVSDRALAGKQMPAMTSSEASPMMAIAGLFLTFRFSQDATASTGTRLYKIAHRLRVVDRHSDASSTGMDVGWLSDRPIDNENTFVLVLQEGTPRAVPNANPQSPLAPLNHLGFALPSREAVDAIANEAKQAGVL